MNLRYNNTTLRNINNRMGRRSLDLTNPTITGWSGTKPDLIENTENNSNNEKEKYVEDEKKYKLSSVLSQECFLIDRAFFFFFFFFFKHLRKTDPSYVVGDNESQVK